MSEHLTDAHYDWTTRFTGKDPRQVNPPPADAQTSVNGAAAAPKSKSGEGFFDKLGDLASDAAHAVGGAVESAGSAIEGAAVTVGRGVEHAAVAAGSAIEGAAVTVGRGIEHAAVAAGSAIEGAAVTAGRGIEHAAEAVGSAVEGAAVATGHAVSGAIDAVEDALGHGPKAAKAEAAAKKASAMSDDDLKKLPSADKVAMLKDLEGNGKPSGDLRKAQIKIFKNMELDPAFKKKESERADKVADEVKDDADVKASSNDWAGRPKDQKVKAMNRILTAQCKQLGLPVPEILPYDKAPDASGNVEDGNYDPSDGKLHFNTNPGANKTFADAMDTVVHEMSHAYQNDLVKRLKDGKIKPGDPEYAQAAMFEVNDSGDSYIQPDEDMKAYVAQPEENHARIVAADYIDKIQKKLTGPAPAAGTK